ncbi:hypothetical protein [Alicyclobacillus ferrooxydans]|uniref:hypothetical protein n=1 Tax=Alicyclobacillus ferrooxydans TaxID=471514 RepID=UPI0006D57FDE|nr:hypothetical protein [Alicyclobacillus ferrooxydans]
MKLNKFVVSGLALACVTMASGVAAVPAMAATQSGGYTMAATHINLDGQNVSNPEHVIAKDPWSGSNTTWIPIYYLQQALKRVGFQTTWNGTDLVFTKYPTNWKFGALGNQEANPVVAPTGQMQISLVEGAPPSMNFPRLVAMDPASGANTTYVPIYYIDSVLRHDFSMGATWDGINWDLTGQGYNPISTTSYATSTEAANQIASIQGGSLSGAPVNLGYGITAMESAGMGHARYEWQEGNWVIEVRYYTMNTGVKQVAEDMVSYLHTHMLPAPNNHGVIIVNSTDTSTAFNSKTIIAWQEGTKVNELQQSGNPVQALATVVNQN